MLKEEWERVIKSLDKYKMSFKNLDRWFEKEEVVAEVGISKTERMEFDVAPLDGRKRC